MGIAADGRPVGAAGRTTAPPPRRASAEAVADISLEEAYHGTTRLVEVDGKRLEVTIPKGADTGTRIRFTGKAPGGGDLYVVVRQDRDRVFTRRGADLERELPLSLREALLGADVHVRTLKGRVLLTVPAGTQPGKTFRLTGQGMPRFKADGFGDLYVKARVVLPADLSPDAKRRCRALPRPRRPARPPRTRDLNDATRPLHPEGPGGRHRGPGDRPAAAEPDPRRRAPAQRARRGR